jgi:hypothetical protein
MTISKLGPVIILTFLTIVFGSFPNIALAAPSPATEPLKSAFILFVPERGNMLEAAQVQALIETGGGRVIHTFPYQAFILEAPERVLQQLSGHPAVAAIFTEAVELSTVDSFGPDARHLAGVWNNVIAPQAATSDMNLLAEEHPAEQNDAFRAPDLLATSELSLAAQSSVTPGYYQTSDYMAGSVAVGIILVESSGAVDHSSENWTEDEKQLVFSEVVTALNWWAQLEPRAKLHFVYDNHLSKPLLTSVEPISRPYIDERYWIADAMAALGYQASSYFERVRAYNNTLRAAYQTDWAFTIFVVDSSADQDNRFSDGYFAYAYLGGPFMVMTSENNGYGPHNLKAVAAHEIGHIFHALDQYSSAFQPCTRRAGYLNVENQNSQYGSCTSSMRSIMRGQTSPYFAKAIDPYAAGQIGWRDSDGDSILDPLDTRLPVTIDSLIQSGSNLTISGMAEIVPYPSPGFASVTINKLTAVKYRLDLTEWQPALAADGVFDSTAEAYQFQTVVTSPGRHKLEVAAVDSAGNVSELYATEIIHVFDPVDGGLNTELNKLGEPFSINQSPVTLSGVSYHLQGYLIQRVEYRVNGGPWQLAIPQDGAFDSDNEPFTIQFSLSQSDSYLVEAFATDSQGIREYNVARQEIKVSSLRAQSIFLPMISVR